MVNVIVVTPDEYEKVKKRNEKKIQKVVKKHPKDEAQIRKCIRFCLDMYLFDDEGRCKKEPLSNGKGHFHLRRTTVPYVIVYEICECTDKRKKPIVSITELDVVGKAEKTYDR